MDGRTVGMLFVFLGLALAGLAVYFYRRSRATYRQIQEKLLALATLEVDTSRLLEPYEVAPGLEKLLDRLADLLAADRAAIFIAERWREVLPAVTRGLPQEFLAGLRTDGDVFSSFVFQQGGPLCLGDVASELQLPAGEDERVLRLRGLMERHDVRSLTAVSLQTRERSFGVLLFAERFRTSRLRLLNAFATQISLTLENYVLMHKAQRRTKEYGLLTHVGQVVSSHLDSDEVVRTIHQELGQLFDTSNFYVAFVDGEELRFELEVEEGKVLPKRSCKLGNGISEHVIRTGKSLLVRCDMESLCARLGAVQIGRPAKSFCGVPIFRYGQSVGVIAALHYQNEFVYDQRDQEVMETAAGQLAVAMENAKLFAAEQHRARYLAFLNNVSRTAISSQDAEQMLEEIVAEVQKNFNFDHVGIGILEYGTRDVEIKAEGGNAARALGKRIPLGMGIIGRVARTNEMVLVQDTASESHLATIDPNARSVVCLPLTYGDTLLGVLNVESCSDHAFPPQEVLILRTLADLLATALHNAFVFQKMQQQSITDGLTGLKTRRFFMEAVQAERKRASRSGRPFSVVMVDLDKFKEANDNHGHLEGDLLLARVGRLLEQKCRQSNVVARYGGDEFVILMPETGVEQAQILSERLRVWIATDPMLNEHHITGSFGVATYPLHGHDVEDIVRVADAGMYVSKQAGGNQVSTAEEFVEGENLMQQRQFFTSYIENFLARENLGVESAAELISTLHKLGEGIRGRENVEGLRAAVRILTRAGETREVCCGHGDAVAKYAETIGHELLLPEDEMADLVFAGRVHDVGKIVIPEKILNKAGPLTPEEYEVVKRHAAIGGDLVETVPGGARLRGIVRHHHERFDGTGYPDGLKGEQIPMGARIVAIAESYVEMTAERPYAPARSSADALAELESMSGIQFDGMLVRVFIHQLKMERATRSGL